MCSVLEVLVKFQACKQFMRTREINAEELQVIGKPRVQSVARKKTKQTTLKLVCPPNTTEIVKLIAA